MASNYEDSAPIDVDSNSEQVAEVDNRVAKRPATTQIGAYKPSSTVGSVGELTPLVL